MRVWQLCARLEYGDAVSNHVMEIDRALASWGFETGIFANTRDEFGRQAARPDEEYSSVMESGEDLLIYHYSLFCPNYRQYLESRNRRILVYHNITPPEFFAAYDKGVAEFCRLGRELLPELADCDLALGDSEFNRLELVGAGFDPEKTAVLPIFVDYRGLLGQEGGRGPMAAWKSAFKVLFVGRAVPNKRLEDVLRAFYYYNRCIDASSHLFLVGPSWVEGYDARLQWLVDSFGLYGNVHFTGRVSDADLAACYRDADLFLSMSEHEGFGVPLVESMAFDLPVLAYSSTAIPYTLGGAGVTFSDKDFPRVGELMGIMRSDSGLRRAVIEGQRGRLAHFAPSPLRETLKGYLDRVLVESGW
ncbi:MAG: glycosyltransferase [Actinobacteria bacterium]|nr:glycosyltransferase [Actinomycetota bacterium]MBU4239940.1 glycosyltransferase [Actinomycetota bacterium]MBU4301288.1 glycosyltransferase [Actinomycetota bacterium]MBU4490796.1 glycosyltransferase [Actinomycetota bacterium]